MKKETLIVTIPKPCSEKWGDMALADRGRFCGSCRKTVVDFSRLPDAEIINVFKTAKDEVPCGRFHISQLDRGLVAHRRPDSFSFILLKRIAASLLFFQTIVTTAWAQSVKPKTHQQSKTRENAIKDKIRAIRGRVIDHVTNQPLHGMIVSADEIDISDTTDNKGYFSLQLPDSFDKKSIRITAHYSALSGSELNGTVILPEDISTDIVSLAKEVIIYRYPMEMNDQIKVVDNRRPFVEGSVTGMLQSRTYQVRKKTFWQKLTAPFRKKNDNQ